MYERKAGRAVKLARRQYRPSYPRYTRAITALNGLGAYTGSTFFGNIIMLSLGAVAGAVLYPKVQDYMEERAERRREEVGTAYGEVKVLRGREKDPEIEAELAALRKRL
jgi:hypothetical protein